MPTALLSSQLFWWSSIILLWTFFCLQQRDCKQFFDIYFTASWQQVGCGVGRRGEQQTGPGSEHEQRVGTLYKVQISSRAEARQASAANQPNSPNNCSSRRGNDCSRGRARGWVVVLLRLIAATGGAMHEQQEEGKGGTGANGGRGGDCEKVLMECSQTTWAAASSRRRRRAAQHKKAVQHKCSDALLLHCRAMCVTVTAIDTENHQWKNNYARTHTHNHAQHMHTCTQGSTHTHIQMH